MTLRQESTGSLCWTNGTMIALIDRLSLVQHFTIRDFLMPWHTTTLMCLHRLLQHHSSWITAYASAFEDVGFRSVSHLVWIFKLLALCHIECRWYIRSPVTRIFACPFYDIAVVDLLKICIDGLRSASIKAFLEMNMKRRFQTSLWWSGKDGSWWLLFRHWCEFENTDLLTPEERVFLLIPTAHHGHSRWFVTRIPGIRKKIRA